MQRTGLSALADEQQVMEELVSNRFWMVERDLVCVMTHCQRLPPTHAIQVWTHVEILAVIWRCTLYDAYNNVNVA